MTTTCTNRRCTRKGFRWTCRVCGRQSCQQHCTNKDHKTGEATCQTCARTFETYPVTRKDGRVVNVTIPND